MWLLMLRAAQDSQRSGGLDGVSEMLPVTAPQRRPELDRRWVLLGPADVDLGHAGRKPPQAAVHGAIVVLPHLVNR